VIYFDSEQNVKSFKPIEEISGKLDSQDEEDKLMRSVMGNDKKTIEEGMILNDAINAGLNSFTPDLMFEQLVKNYSMAKKMMGPSLIREVSGYDDGYVEKNIKIPEFQREVKKNIKKNVDDLKKDGLIDKNGILSDKGVELASLVLYTEELDHLIPKGILGEKIHKKSFIYGGKEDTKQYKKGDRYRDIAIKKSIKLAVRRGKKKLSKEELQTYERQSKGQIYLVYALDASGSMKGKKIEVCKKAGIALAFKAIEEKDKVGLMVFGADVKERVDCTLDFKMLLHSITKIKAAKETNLAKTVNEAVMMFPSNDVGKHLILLTDAMPTIGEEPEKDTIEAVSIARANGITISLIGVQLDKKGEELAKKIVAVGEGKLYMVKDLDELDRIVLEDYYSVI